MFVNEPFTTTVYTNNTGAAVYTATLLDLDLSAERTDELVITKSPGDNQFELDSSNSKYLYQSE